ARAAAYSRSPKGAAVPRFAIRPTRVSRSTTGPMAASTRASTPVSRSPCAAASTHPEPPPTSAQTHPSHRHTVERSALSAPGRSNGELDAVRLPAPPRAAGGDGAAALQAAIGALAISTARGAGTAADAGGREGARHAFDAVDEERAQRGRLAGDLQV